MARQLACDVCVLGAGPAGAILARQLARLHHDVLLVHRGAPGVLRAESVPAATLSTLESVGLRGKVEPAIFLRQYGALAAWQSDAVQQLHGASAQSVLIDRTLFDDQLRAAAIDSGARFVHASSVASPTRSAPHQWSIQARDADGPVVITATFFVDARGKQRRDKGSVVASRTAAMSAMWERRGESDDTTRLEALEDAWCWGMPARDRRYSATVFLDEHRVSGSDAGDRTRLFRQLLARTRLLRHLVDRQPMDDVMVCDATAGLSGTLIGEDVIRVGEAAWSIDPVSSQGLQCALVSALQGAAAVHTMCGGGDCAAASEFYVSRQRRAATSAFENTATAYARRRGPDGCSFWKRRSTPPSTGLSAGAAPHGIPSGPLPATIAISPELRIVDAPLLAGSEIVRGQAISHPALKEPVAFFGGVPLVPLLRVVRGETATTTIEERWGQRLPRHVARTILNWMYAAGLFLDSAAEIAARRQPTDIR